MLALDSSEENIDYFIKYPNIGQGYLGLALEKENITSFDLLENKAQNANYPILLFDNNSKTYSINIYGFEVTTDSQVTVDKMIINISDDSGKKLIENKTLSKNYNFIEN
jgi:hypothetical protein